MNDLDNFDKRSLIVIGAIILVAFIAAMWCLGDSFNQFVKEVSK